MIGGAYRKARMLVSEGTYSRFIRYEPTNIIPASAEVDYAMTGGVFTIYFIYRYMHRQRCG